MPKFLFQPDPIDGYEFRPIPVDIHLGIIKIPTEEFLNDFGTNTTETTLVGTDRKEVLGYLQKHFARELHRLGTLRESESCYVIMKLNKHRLDLENILRNIRPINNEEI